MGRITEALKYLKSDPKQLNEIKQGFTHLTITKELKELRKELKLYEKKPEN